MRRQSQTIVKIIVNNNYNLLLKLFYTKQLFKHF